MGLYEIREAAESDIKTIVEVYNSNAPFLLRHLGVEAVDEQFIFNEMREMKREKFLSCVIIDLSTNAVIGALDYRPDSTVYLSLLMLASEYQKCGVGRAVYTQFEENMRQWGKAAIRIDVVNDSIGNAAGFWEKRGFVSIDEIELQWGQKQFAAEVMIKRIV